VTVAARVARLVSPRTLTSLFLAGAFVAFLVSQAPHLVHHFFEPDLVQDECPFAASGDRIGGLQTEPVVVAVSDVSMPVLPAAPLAPASLARAVPLGRAPPSPRS
jgi:hypothetical protein